VFHHVLDVAGGNGEVEAVDRGGVDPDPDLALSGLGGLDVGELGRGAELGQYECAQWGVSFVGWWGGG
jgi:hypothetical protein